ncbi:hypothetical protein VNO77_09358 [Canavalia gladiata]|uniref:NB-ARC domain-containing protein n=1 Tax=Canavalia gladiata TaxID=3824 RepID=A0AAN9QWI8_CANGL
MATVAVRRFSGKGFLDSWLKWTAALTKASNFIGWDMRDCRDEAELVKKIVDDVLVKLDNTLLSITEFPVGLEPRVQRVVRFVEHLSTRVRTIGIWGMGGLGKTTAAKVIYNQIHRKFENRSFIENVRKVCEKDSRGHIRLQKQLLYDILKTKVKIHSIAMGTTTIEKRLCGTTVLIVLDDVNNFDQINALCGNRTWLGSGSVLIVTTRDARLLDLLNAHYGTGVIEGLALKLDGASRDCFEANAFQEMNRLRLLQLDCVQLIGDFGYLSKQLRWVYWQGFPLKCIPDNFYLGSVVALDLKHSNLRLVWKDPQLLEWLKILNLSHSKYLTVTPDFTKLPNLENLIFKDCPSLCMVHQSIGDLHKLLLINLKDCTNLCNLPRSTYKLKSVKTLILSGCLKIDKLEEDIVQMESLTILIAENTAVKQVPFSIVRSKSIGYISLCGYEGLSRNVFPSIIWSWMSPTMNPLSNIHSSSGMLSYLVSMDVQNYSLGDLAPILTSLSKLRSVLLQCDTQFKLFNELKRILGDVYRPNSCELEIKSYSLEISKDSLRSYLIGFGNYQQVFNTLSKSISQVPSLHLYLLMLAIRFCY